MSESGGILAARRACPPTPSNRTGTKSLLALRAANAARAGPIACRTDGSVDKSNVKCDNRARASELPAANGGDGPAAGSASPSSIARAMKAKARLVTGASKCACSICAPAMPLA
eukprot:scaffold31369_cov48-Tisochrysis_lutea.AAC.2